MEGLLSTGPTPSSFLLKINFFFFFVIMAIFSAKSDVDGLKDKVLIGVLN